MVQNNHSLQVHQGQLRHQYQKHRLLRHCQKIPGMSEHLYPTLVADASLSTPAVDNCSILQNQITSEIDKYLQEAEERCERDDNYFNRWNVATNTSSPQQEANLLEQDEEDDEVRVLESNGQDTGT